MKNIRLLITGFLGMVSAVTYAQKTVSEGTIIYNIVMQPKAAGTKAGNGLNTAQTTIYLKGGMSRTDMTSALGTETTIYNAKLGNAAILKEYSGQKLMITLTKENWENRNKKFDGVTFINGTETKLVEGYNCKKATAKLGDGSSVSVYYTADLVVMNKDYDQAFKNLPGFPVEYELETAKMIFKYHLSKIDFSALPASKFDFPKAGYRIMTYDENKAENLKRNRLIHHGFKAYREEIA